MPETGQTEPRRARYEVSVTVAVRLYAGSHTEAAQIALDAVHEGVQGISPTREPLIGQQQAEARTLTEETP